MTSIAHAIHPNFSTSTPFIPLAVRRAALLAAVFDFTAPAQPIKADLKAMLAEQRAA